jgi:methylthioribose-1-phosphate isomerase
MVGYVMQKGIVDKILVGADRITRTGHIFNKIGTYQIAVLAKKHNIPFYCAAPESTFDLNTDYKDVEIEQRNIDEVLKIGNNRIVSSRTRILNPAFDVTPPELVTAIITENGIIRPEFHETIPKLVKT